MAWYGIPNFSKNNCKKNLKNSIDFIDYISNLNSIKKVIFSGTCLEYLKKNGECSENDYLNNKNYFSTTKNKIRKYAFNKLIKKNICVIWFRIFYVYGKYQRQDSLIPSILYSIKNNKDIIVKSPNFKLDFIHISDVVKILKKAIDFNIESGIYNLGTGKTSSIIEIANFIKSKISYNKDIIIPKKKYKISQKIIFFYANNTKTKRIFNFNKFKSLNNGIKEMIYTHDYI